MSTRMRTDRSGMSLVELLVALTLFSVVLVGALGAFDSETRVFRAGNDQLATVQNYRYAVQWLEQDLRQAGAGVLATQPSLVYAGTDVLAFNADYASRTPGDISAVFVDPDAPLAAVTALTQVRRTRIPTTAFSYPDTTYTAGGMNSPAEMITFYLAPDDATTSRTDDYVLYRQVNDLAPEELARRLVKLEGRSFFEYTELVTSDTAADAMVPLPEAVLPLAHEAPTHLSPADTGAAGRIDQLRAVRVNAGAWNGRTGDASKVVPVSRLIWLRNIRERDVQMCGDAPLGAPRPTALAGTNASGDPEVMLSWSPSPDETRGEGDIVRYVIWRRRAGSSDWGDPYLSLPSGDAAYLYRDAAVEAGQTYEYAISAQDCTPALSDPSPGAVVAVPAL